MSLLLSRSLLKALKPLRNQIRFYVMFHPFDGLTGLAKKEYLAYVAGDCDPFRMMPIKGGPGTRERPNLIPSSCPNRMVGCICDEHTTHINWICVHLNDPVRCGCGYWFELCPVARFGI